MQHVSRIAATAVAAFGVVAATAASAADKVTLQLKWVTQGQFAGYYVAQDKGFYKDAGLDVTIKPGGPDIAPEQVIAAGGADVIVDWMPAALAAREKGEPLVNIAQIFQKSAQMTTCRKDTGITKPADFKGKTIGVWFGGNEYPFMTWMNKLGYSYTGAKPDVILLKQGFNVDPLLQKQADCIATMVYNEYWQIIESGQLKADDLVTFKWQDQGVGMLEDGLYTLEKNLRDPKEVDKLARFVARLGQGLGLRRRAPGRGGGHRPQERHHRRPDPAAPDHPGAGDRQAARRRQGHGLPRAGRLRAHGQDPDGEQGPDQGAEGCLDPQGLRRVRQALIRRERRDATGVRSIAGPCEPRGRPSRGWCPPVGAVEHRPESRQRCGRRGRVPRRGDPRGGSGPAPVKRLRPRSRT